MKKKVLFVIISVFIILGVISIPTNAQIIENNENRDQFHEEYFNVIRGYLEDDIDYIEHAEYDLTRPIKSGELIFTNTYVYDFYYPVISISFFVEEGEIVDVLEKVNDQIFFYARNVKSANPIVEVDEEFDFSLYFNSDKLYRPKDTVVDTSKCEFYPGYSEDDMYEDSFSYYPYIFTRVATYKLNATYNGKDIYYPVEFDNPPTVEEIIADANISDITSECTVTYDKCIYDPNNITLNGEYSFRVIIKDSSLNTVAQVVNIKAVDIKKPEIVQNNPGDILVEYNNTLTDENIKNAFTITDNSNKDISITVDISNYTANSTKLGTYPSSITATDSSGNTKTVNFNIVVQDTTKPIIQITSAIKIDAQSKITEEEIKGNMTASDEYDGNISSKIIIEGYDNYELNCNKLGRYELIAKVYDSSNNMIASSFYIDVIDSDYPVLEFKTPVITVDKGAPVSREMIVQFFIDKGYNMTIEGLESEYFELEYAEGTYPLTITTEEGKSEKATITTDYKEIEISYDAPIKEEEKDNKNYYLIGGIAGAILIVCSILGVIIYKKRH